MIDIGLGQPIGIVRPPAGGACLQGLVTLSGRWAADNCWATCCLDR